MVCRKGERGFTLVELLVVISIIATLMSLLFVYDGDPSLLDHRHGANPGSVSAIMKINGGVSAGSPILSAETARPSSQHPTGVNVAFADGHVNFMREDIDYYVYQQLMTPHGKKSDMPARRYVPGFPSP